MKIRSRLITCVAAWLLVRGLRAVYWTIRRDVEIFDPDTIAYDPQVRERYLYCTWHDSIVMPLFHGRPHHMAAIVSQHQDGSYLAAAMRYLHVRPVRGSSSKGGIRALREAISITQDHHITVTPDGPRGPRREMKEGIVFLAAHSRRAIVPMAFRCTRVWRWKGTWTDLVIPQPFSRVTLLLGEPIRVPHCMGREELVAWTTRLQHEMDTLYARAENTETAARLAASPSDTASGTLDQQDLSRAA